MSLPLTLKKHKGYYTLDIFEDFNIRALFTTRVHNMRFETRKGASNPLRKSACQRIGVAWSHLVCPSQVHGDSVAVVDEAHRGRGACHRQTAIADTDSLITQAVGMPIAVLTADCLPVFIFDQEKKVIALIHAGWRGVYQKILAKTVRKMSETFSCLPQNLIVAFGPAIRSCCYEVGRDFRKYFKKGLGERDSHTYFDLVGVASAQLLASGVFEEHLYDSSLCTSCRNEEFFSYRCEGAQTGRSMSVMEILLPHESCAARES